MLLLSCNLSVGEEMTAFIGRRDFIALLGGAAASWPLAARAQEIGQGKRIGFLRVGEPPAASSAAFAEVCMRWD